jgi:hypothetical protein
MRWLWLVLLAGCRWHYVVVPQTSNVDAGYACSVARNRCFAAGGWYGFYACQQHFYDCLREVPGAVTFVVPGRRDPVSQCALAGIPTPRRCATQEY